MHADQPLDRVALACLQCRQRHVKCDATQPSCNRCNRSGKECTYQASRRGGLDKAALARARLRRQEEQEQRIVNLRSGHDGTVLQNTNVLELYYEYFWRPFPMVLPYHFLLGRLKNKTDHGLSALMTVMEWIGSLYTSFSASQRYYNTALQMLQQPVSTPFNVQALALLAVAQHHCDDRGTARITLDRAIVMALQLNMDKQDFARQYAEHDAVLEESCRRTYYILYSIDQEFSVVSRILSFVLADVVNTVDLPCDNSMYESGIIPPTSTWRDYENKDLQDIEQVFSSLTYAHDLRTFVAAVTNRISKGKRLDESLIESIDIKIASWQALLPASKKDPLHLDGTIDEVVWQAHASAAMYVVHEAYGEFITDAISSLMTIHRPVSNLPYNLNELTTTSFMALGPIFPLNPTKQAAHAARTLKALESYGSLLAIDCMREKHSVFSMCITAQMATIQISACKNAIDSELVAIGRDRLRLFIGHLNTMGKYWPLGRIMVNEVKAIARLAFGEEQGSSAGAVAEEVDSEVGQAREFDQEVFLEDNCPAISMPAD